MIIAIDYDDTFTADTLMFTETIKKFQEFGHQVICVSARRETFANRREIENALPSGVEVFLSYDCPKRLFTKMKGVYVDIWIDDKPDAIIEEGDTEDYWCQWEHFWTNYEGPEK